MSLEICTGCGQIDIDGYQVVKKYTFAGRQLVLHKGLAHTLLIGANKKKALAKIKQAAEPIVTYVHPTKIEKKTMAEIEAAEITKQWVEQLSESPTLEIDPIEPLTIEATPPEPEPAAVSEWRPDPNEWFSCTIRARDTQRRYMTGTLSTNEKVWIPERRVRSSPGSHTLCSKIPIGTEMSVRIEPAISYDGWRCTEAIINGDYVAEKDVRVVVYSWAPAGTYGHTNRQECGCAIFCLTSSGTEAYDARPGDILIVDVQWSTKAGNWIGLVRQLERSTSSDGVWRT